MIGLKTRRYWWWSPITSIVYGSVLCNGTTFWCTGASGRPQERMGKCLWKSSGRLILKEIVKYTVDLRRRSNVKSRPVHQINFKFEMRKLCKFASNGILVPGIVRILLTEIWSNRICWCCGYIFRTFSKAWQLITQNFYFFIIYPFKVLIQIDFS